jgi:hypothetical protein
MPSEKDATAHPTSNSDQIERFLRMLEAEDLRRGAISLQTMRCKKALLRPKAFRRALSARAR